MATMLNLQDLLVSFLIVESVAVQPCKQTVYSEAFVHEDKWSSLNILGAYFELIKLT